MIDEYVLFLGSKQSIDCLELALFRSVSVPNCQFAITSPFKFEDIIYIIKINQVERESHAMQSYSEFIEL